jgi:hypothetical protein
MRGTLHPQWAWYVHRLNPRQYVRDTERRFGWEVHPSNLTQALGFCAPSAPQPVGDAPSTFASQSGSQASDSGAAQLTAQRWRDAYPEGPDQPPEHTLWPPAPPCPSSVGPDPACSSGAQAAQQDEAARGASSEQGGPPEDVAFTDVRAYVLEAMPRQRLFLHQASPARVTLSGYGWPFDSAVQQLAQASCDSDCWAAARQVLRWPYLTRPFLALGRERYARFLAVAAMQPDDGLAVRRGRPPQQGTTDPVEPQACHSPPASRCPLAALCRPPLCPLRRCPCTTSTSCGTRTWRTAAATWPTASRSWARCARSRAGATRPARPHIGGPPAAAPRQREPLHGSRAAPSAARPAGQVLGHDDGLAGEALKDPFAVTRGRYEVRGRRSDDALAGPVSLPPPRQPPLLPFPPTPPGSRSRG